MSHPLDAFEDQYIIDYVKYIIDLDVTDMYSHATLEQWAYDHGFIQPYEVNIYEAAADQGLTLGHDRATVDKYHDDNGHSGAVAFCTHPFCKGEY